MVVEHGEQGMVVVDQQIFIAVTSALPVAPVARPAIGPESLELAGCIAGEHRVEDAARIGDAAKLIKGPESVVGPAAAGAAVLVILEPVAAVFQSGHAKDLRRVVVIRRWK